MRKHFSVEMKALDKTCIQSQLKCSLLSAGCKMYGHAGRRQRYPPLFFNHCADVCHKGKMTFNCNFKYTSVMTGNINETARPLVLMVTQVGCDVLIDLGQQIFLLRVPLAVS